MKIEKIKIEQLKPAKYNPRKNLTEKDPEYQKIKKSIIKFGYVAPIIVNKDFTVIGGHQRLKVLEELGYKEIECNVVNLNKKEERCSFLSIFLLFTYYNRLTVHSSVIKSY